MWKYLVFSICVPLFMISQAFSETMYVGDLLEITFRTGPGMQHKVVDMIPSGQTLTVLKKGDGWSEVQLPDGRKGWVLSRYLTTTKPNKVKLDYLENKNKLLTEEIDSLNRENENLKAENDNLRQLMDKKQTEYETLKNNYEKLRTDSSDFLKLKAAYTRCVDRMSIQNVATQELKKKYDTLRKSMLIQGGLIGAGILLLGLLIGMRYSGRQRRYRY